MIEETKIDINPGVSAQPFDLDNMLGLGSAGPTPAATQQPAPATGGPGVLGDLMDVFGGGAPAQQPQA